MPALPRLAASVLLLLLPGLALAQAPSPNARITTLLDDLSAVKTLGQVALSPDGKTVAMVLAGTLTLQAVDNPGSARPAAVCAGKSVSVAVKSLSWAPDGAHLGVLADCGSQPGVYLVDPRSPGKSHQLAELHGYAKSLQYAPDGKYLGLLYVEGATRPSGALAAMKPPSGVIGVEGLEIQKVVSIDAASGALAIATPASLHVYEFDWSPDSKRLAYIAAPPPGENNWWVAKLYTQAAAGGDPKLVLDPVTVDGPLHGLQIAVPRWSPDGSQIAFIGGLMSDQGATGGDIYVLPFAGGALKKIIPDAQPDVTATWLRWDDNDQIGFSYISAGKSGFSNVHPANNAADTETNFLIPATVGDGRLEMSLSFANNGDVAFVRSSFDHAPEVWAGHIPGDGVKESELHQITHLNEGEKPHWGKTESVEWTSDSFHVQGWLLYPADYDPARKYPLIVMVHGGPSSAVIPRWPGASFGAAPFSAMGYFVLEPNPRGSYGEGEAFTQANRKDFGYGDLRDVLAGVDAVEKKLPIDDRRVGLAGWSYGGFMTMFDITQTRRFRAAVAGAGISDWLSYYGENSIDQWMIPFFGASVYDDPAVYARSSAITFIKQVKTPTLVVVGDRDGECPAPQSFEFWHALKELGVDTQLVVYPNEGHGFTSIEHRRDVVTRAVQWFDTHMQ